jgi:hypothetical protein
LINSRWISLDGVKMANLGKPGSGGWFTVIGIGPLAALASHFLLHAGAGALVIGIVMGAVIWFVLEREGRKS